MKFLVIYVFVLLGLWEQCCSYPIDNEKHSIRMCMQELSIMYSLVVRVESISRIIRLKNYQCVIF